MARLRTSSTRQTAFTRLLAWYVTGRITRDQWAQLTAVLDAEGVTMDERLALAWFVNEVLTEGPAGRTDRRRAAGDLNSFLRTASAAQAA